MIAPMRSIVGSTFPPLLLLSIACGGDDHRVGTAADLIGVGAQCTEDDDCLQPEEGEPAQVCLMEFKGGYCGLADCTGDSECPSGSACVLHSDDNTYCFRICRDKAECNLNRVPDVYSNCSANVTFIETTQSAKACVPPSAG